MFMNSKICTLKVTLFSLNVDILVIDFNFLAIKLKHKLYEIIN